MNRPSPQASGAGLPHSILDLAPLELECMNALWPAGESTVRDIQFRLADSRPRAYTTIMTIMDRLSHKGIVTRRRVGRAYRYSASLSADEARGRAVEKIVAAFFSGSPQALAAHLAAQGEQDRAGVPVTARIASRNRSEVHTAEAVRAATEAQPQGSGADLAAEATGEDESASGRLDETLL